MRTKLDIARALYNAVIAVRADPTISAYLKQRDPQAMKQLDEAAKAFDDGPGQIDTPNSIQGAIDALNAREAILQSELFEAEGQLQTVNHRIQTLRGLLAQSRSTTSHLEHKLLKNGRTNDG